MITLRTKVCSETHCGMVYFKHMAIHRDIDQMSPDSIKHQPAHFSLTLSSASFCIRVYGTLHTTMQFYFILCKVVLSTEAFVMENVIVDGKCHFKICVDCFSNLSGGIRSSTVMKFKEKLILSANS